MACPCCCPPGTTRCEGDCCSRCRTLTGAGNGSSVNTVTEPVCTSFFAETIEYDQPCALNRFTDFAGIVSSWGPDTQYNLVRQSAIEKYTGSRCQFAELTAAQLRSGISRAFNEEGICICYWVRPVFWYRVYFFIYRCAAEQWVNVTDEIATTSLHQVLTDEGNPPAYFEPRPCEGEWTNGNPPPLPAMPPEYPCAGPFSACGNVFP